MLCDQEPILFGLGNPSGAPRFQILAQHLTCFKGQVCHTVEVWNLYSLKVEFWIWIGGGRGILLGGAAAFFWRC